MPFINDEQKEKYKNLALQIAYLPQIETKGDLEYLAYLLMLKYMETRENKYTPLHDAVYGVWHSADEFKRQFLDKREDKAKQMNPIVLPKIQGVKNG